MTKELAAKAIELHEMFPHMSQQEIANALKVNAGRVSEALSGKYHE
jgi:predicted XRE-type DNA-binding protein